MSESKPADTQASNDQSRATDSSRGQSVGIKETITNLVIAFMLAFLFRGFVIEGFVIPTGSMAPTLLGKHIRFTSPYNGYDWAVGPWDYVQGTQTPLRTQSELIVNDPISTLEVIDSNRRLAAGDRVFVLKYLPFLQTPKRWDVVVFKNPGTNENYIKRLVGMPSEQIAFVDGDVFARPAPDGIGLVQEWESWTVSDWKIQRKPERVQRTMFQDVFNSSLVPIGEQTSDSKSPFTAAGSGWVAEGAGKSYAHSGDEPSTLVWNGNREITDFNAYNQTRKSFKPFVSSDGTAQNHRQPYPVSDVSLKLNIKSDGEPVRVSPILEARGMQFRATISEDSGQGIARVQMRVSPGDPWGTLDEGEFGAFASGDWHTIEFWHVDQALWLFIDDTLVCGGDEEGGYELTPAERAVASTNQMWGQLAANKDHGDGIRTTGVFAYSPMYTKPSFRWDFSGGSFEISNIIVQRDIGYHISKRLPTRGAHPENTPTIQNDEYFMCGDNSANSADSRLWEPGTITPWIEEEINDRVGMVHRDLIVGRAFVVYFPAMLDDGPMLSPDFGRVRWIW